MNEGEGVKRAAQSMGGRLVRMDVKVVKDSIKRDKWKERVRRKTRREDSFLQSCPDGAELRRQQCHWCQLGSEASWRRAASCLFWSSRQPEVTLSLSLLLAVFSLHAVAATAGCLSFTRPALSFKLKHKKTSLGVDPVEPRPAPPCSRLIRLDFCFSSNLQFFSCSSWPAQDNNVSL